MNKWITGMQIAAACGAVMMAQEAALAAPRKAPAPAAAPAAVTELTLVHPFEGERAAALQKVVDGFNAANSRYRVSAQAGVWEGAAGGQMAILLGDDMERALGGKPAVRPLAAVMKDGGVALQTSRAPAMMMRGLVDAKGQLQALPVAQSTPVMYINRTEFRRVGLNPDAPPKTWFDLQQALGQLSDAGSQCPYTVSQPGRVMIENTSAWHNEPVAARQGNAERVAFNGMLQVKHVAMMASWHRARYLRTFAADSEAEKRFAEGECAVIAAPSSSATDFRARAKFEIGIASLPYHDDFNGAPQNTLSEGGAMWVAAGRPKAEYQGVAQFVAYWLQPQNQATWQRESGFLPLSRGGVLAGMADAPAGEADNNRVALAQLAAKPATADSSASSFIGRKRIQRILDEELSFVWADTKPAKEALDTAVVRVQALLPTLR